MALDPVIGGLIGSVISGIFGSSSASRQMDFQRESFQNKYQWTVRDLKKAGLNPMLAAGVNPQNLQGASTSLPGVGDTLSNAITANRNELTKADVELANSQKGEIDVKRSVEEHKMRIGFYQSQVVDLWARAEYSNAGARALTKEIDVKEAQIRKIGADTDQSRKHIERLEQAIIESKSATARNYLQGELLKEQKNLAQKEAILKDNIAWGQALINTGLQLGLPEREFGHEWYSSDKGKVFEKFKKTVEAFQPLILPTIIGSGMLYKYYKH